MVNTGIEHQKQILLYSRLLVTSNMKISPILEDFIWIFVAFLEPRSGATSERTFAPPKALDSIWKINQHVRLISNTTSRKHPVFLMAESSPILVNFDK